MTRRNWLKLWSGIAGIALIVALILTFIPVGPAAITIGGTLSIGVDYPNQNAPTNLKIGDEVTNLRTETSKTYYLGNDTYEARIYGASTDPNDPSYYSGANDGDWYINGANYNTIWTSATATADPSTYMAVGQFLSAGTYGIRRGALYFDTSSIPSGATITSASVNLHGKEGYTHPVTYFLVTIQNGQPTYPHDPMVDADYNKSYYSGDGGSFNVSSWTDGGYNSITLNSDGMSWINKGGQTKFMVRSSIEISGVPPTTWEYVWADTSEESGTSEDPYLAVTYTPLPWLTGYTYRQEFTIAGTTDGAQTNYTMCLTVNKTGTGSTGSTVCLNDRSLSWTGTVPNDIRFTKLDGTTQLDYWIESSDANTAQVWVEFDSIPVGPNNASFYVYTGKASDTTTSNGANTFIFFDHFDEAWPDGKWTGDTACGSVASSILTFDPAGAAYKAIYSASQANDIALRARYKESDGNYAQLFLAENPISDDYIGIYHDGAQTNHSLWITFKTGAYTVVSNAAIGFGAYHIYDICRYISGTDTLRFYMDGIQVGSDTTTNVPIVNLAALIRAVNVLDYCDWILLRKYTLNEPTWGTWGPEEGGPAITNTQSTWALGYVQANDVKYFSATGSQDDDYATVTNTGTCAVNVAIQGLDMEGGAYDWVLASSAGNQTYSLYANSGNGSSTYNTEVKKSSYSNLVAALPVSSTYLWSMKFTAPTIFNPSDDGAQKTTTVTLVATAT